MKIKIARVKITYEEVKIPHKCPSCGNRFDNEAGKQNRFDLFGLTNGTEVAYIKKDSNTNEYGVHWTGQNTAGSLHDSEIVTGVSCASCGEVIVEEIQEKEYASKEELEHLKSVLGI